MTRRLLITLGVASLAVPGLVRGQEKPYQYEDNQGEIYSNEQGDPGAGTYSEYNAAEAAGQAGQAPPSEGQPEAAPEGTPGGGENPGGQPDVSVDLAAPGASVDFQTFHDALAPYGEWVNVPPYGMVWRPQKVQEGWRPYYYGHWEWSDEGWIWVSDESWGWAPYHYGRWTVAPSLGWIWVPGYEWAPAWVSWRFSEAAVGWAPLLPGFSVYVNSYPDYYIPYFTFVPCHRFVGVPVHSIAFGRGFVPRYFHETRPAPPRAVFGGGFAAPAWGGPAHRFMEQRVGHPIAPARVVPVGSPAAMHSASRAGVVPVYRPGARTWAHPAPGRGPGPAPAPGWHGGPVGAPGRSGPVYTPGRGPAPAPGYHGGPAYRYPAPGYRGTPPPGYRGTPAPGYRGPTAPAPGYRGTPSRSYSPGAGYRQGGFGPGRSNGGGVPRGGGFAPRGGGFGAPGRAGHSAPKLGGSGPKIRR